MTLVLRTARLRLVAIEERHRAGLRALWTDPRVMANVGFPAGLHPDDLHLDRCVAAPGATEPPGRKRGLHLAVETEAGEFVGEAKLAAPDPGGVAEPDVKLLPAWWRRGLGEEVVRALVAETFARWPACRRVRFTPNVENAAGRGLYEKVGARRVGEGHDPPGRSPLRGFAGVRYLVYEIERPAS